MSVLRCQSEVSSAEFTEWMAFECVDPGGYERFDMQAALIASIIANSNRDPKKKAESYTINDFLLRFNKAKELPSQTALVTKLRQWGLTHNKQLENSHVD